MTEMMMIERVAQAIRDNVRPDRDVMDAARAAIAELREPTIAMLESDSYTHGEWSRRAIEAYIDEALR